MKRAASNRSAAETWLHALELTAPIGANPHRIFPGLNERRTGPEFASPMGDALRTSEAPPNPHFLRFS